MIRVDGATYTWMGAPNPQPTLVTQTAFEYTSTRSTFMMSAGAVNMNITFLSPLTPTDLKRQSLPFSYVDVAVSSADGETHDVELYTDITAGETTIFLKIAPSLQADFSRMGFRRSVHGGSVGVWCNTSRID